MAKHLVIVESPAKAKSINKILGKDYKVKACLGHVRDLPEKKLGVDVENNFEPEYTPIKGKKTVLQELSKDAQASETILLAPDPDREGEAIAWHLKAELSKKVDDEKFFRVTYNEITAAAIKKAFSEPTRIDQDKVDAQQARRILDRIVGFQVSPLLWRRIRGGSSAGRVQSVALRLVCEREREIDGFKPEEYWILGVKAAKQVDPKDPFLAKLARINDEKAEIKTGEHAKAIEEEVTKRSLRVLDIKQKEISKKAMPPYITSTLQQAGSRFCSYTPSRTMRIAQSLYEGIDFGEGPSGLITYMRTDSVSIAKEAQEMAKTYIEETYGAEYVPSKPNVFKSRGSAQEAHEAIRPTDVTRTPDAMKQFLKADEHKLYRIIWERFVGSQMSPAKIAQKTVEIEAVPNAGETNTYLFRATASEVTFPGYMKVTGIVKAAKKKKAAEDGEAPEEDLDKLPPMEPNESLDCKEWLGEQKFTQPPARYSEASLIKAMEENGVGRPSTYAAILSTLDHRDYVEKEKSSLKPTGTGLKVNDFLVEHLNELFDVNFTAEMEKSLDEIESGKVEWTGMLSKFYDDFLGWVQKAKGPDADPKLVAALLEAVKPVKEWEPPVKRGNRTYSDEKYVTTVQKQLDEGKKPITDRQLKAFQKLVARYKDQIPDLDKRIDELQLKEAMEAATAEKEPPREETVQKLALLKPVKYDEAKKVGKRTYDDDKFCGSLRDQVESGRRLSENQITYLDRLVVKYSAQIPDYETLKDKLGLQAEETAEDLISGPILRLFETVKEWNPPVQRGKREWSDEAFHDSLSKQFEAKKRLSPKQQSVLKKMVKRYAAQIPSYERVAESLGLPPLKKKADKDAEEA